MIPFAKRVLCELYEGGHPDLLVGARTLQQCSCTVLDNFLNTQWRDDAKWSTNMEMHSAGLIC
jgi:hypothetical protein